MTTIALSPAVSSATGPATGWQRVTLTAWEGLPVWDVHDAHTGAAVGTLCQWTPGRWQAHSPGRVTAAADTSAQVFDAASWLVCVPAAEVAEAVADGGPVCIVLGDGTAMTVRDATATAELVTLHAEVIRGVQLDLATPTMLGAVKLRGAVPPDPCSRFPLFRLTYAARTLVALAPGCGACETLPGQPCPNPHDDYL